VDGCVIPNKALPTTIEAKLFCSSDKLFSINFNLLKALKLFFCETARTLSSLYSVEGTYSLFFFENASIARACSILPFIAADLALLRLEVDQNGLDQMDRRYLNSLAENYGGGPVGIETLAAVLAEQRDMLEEVIEPFLLQTGLLMRTPRGRCLSTSGWSYLGLKPPKELAKQLELLSQDTNQYSDE
jgi:hypothetical protein